MLKFTLKQFSDLNFFTQFLPGVLKKHFQSVASVFCAIVLFCAGTNNTFAQVTLTATTGTTTGSYTTLSAAFAAINAGTHTGAIVININSNTSEPATGAVLNSTGAGSASYSSVLIQPTVDVVSITGATTTGLGLITLNGADFVTINGDNPNSAGTNRNLTITNTAATTVTYTSAIRIAAYSAIITSANSNTIKNCIINGNASAQNTSGVTGQTTAAYTSYGIFAGPTGTANPTSTTTAPSPIASPSLFINSGGTITSLTLDNNVVNACARAIMVQGNVNTVATILSITNNVIGASTPGSSTTVYSYGIGLSGGSGTVSGNTIQDMEAYINASIIGIAIDFNGNLGSGFTIEKNTITSIINRYATGGFGAYGINLVGGTSNVIRNNFIYGLNTIYNSTAVSTSTGIRGIRMSGGTSHKIYHNSIFLSGTPLGGSAADVSACISITSTGVQIVDIRNNILSNTITGAFAGSATTCIQLPSGGTSGMNLLMNNNAYYSNTTSVNPSILTTTAGTTYTAANFLASSTTPATNSRNYTSTLLVANTNNDNASYASTNATPFISTTNLHLNTNSPEIVNVEQKGVTGLSVTTDIDGDTRPNASTTNPDMGADEVVAPACLPPTMGTPGSITATSASILFTCTGCSPGNSYIVEYGASGFTPGTTNTAGAGTVVTGTVSPISISPLTLGNTYDVYVRQSCTSASNGYSVNSNKATFTAVNASPTLTAAGGATVDNSFNITFTDDPTWRAAITSVKYGANTLTLGTDYTISAGILTLIPAGSAGSGLRTAGSQTVTITATNYSTTTVTQAIAAGVATKLGMKTQPTAPASAGAVLATQPAVFIQDQYGNTTASTATVTATVGAGSGSWRPGGNITANGVSGTATFSGLTASTTSGYVGATIIFTSPGLTSITSGTFTVPVAPPSGYCGSGAPAANTTYYWSASTSTSVGHTVTMIWHPVGSNALLTSSVQWQNNQGNYNMVKQGNGDWLYSYDVGAVSPLTFGFFFNNGSGTNYTTANGTFSYTVGGNGNTCAYSGPPATAASNITFPAIGATTLTINCTIGSGANRLIVMRQTSAVDFVPADGNAYTPNTIFTGGTGLGPSGTSKVVYAGASNTVNVTGLTTGALYYVTVYEFNGTSAATDIYLVTGNPTASVIVGAPDVSITAPTNAQAFAAPGPITLTASATSPGSTINTVDFYANDGSTNALVGSGTFTSGSYSYSWSGVAVGSYTITAVATDNNSTPLSTTSAGVPISVTSLIVPTVSVTSPTASTTYYNPGASITLTANAATTSGTVTSVDFYANNGTTNSLVGSGTLISGNSTSGTYTYNWTSITNGVYSITAVATGSNTGVATSAAVNNITVATSAAPAVSLTAPTNGTSYYTGANITITATASAATTRTISSVKIYAGATLLATLTSSPYTYTWTGVANGSYTITAVVTDNVGSTTTSSGKTITVANPPLSGYCGYGGSGQTDFDWSAVTTYAVGNTVTMTWHPVSARALATTFVTWNNNQGNYPMVKQSNGDWTYGYNVGAVNPIVFGFTYNDGSTQYSVPNTTFSYTVGSTCNYYATPSTAASNITFPAKGTTSLTIACTSGDGTNRLIVVRQGSAVDFTPVDGTAYTPNSSFTAGTGLGTSATSKVVYAGTSNTVDVTGLTANTLYYVAVYEFNGTTTLTKYLTTGAPTASTTTYASAPSVSLTSPGAGASYYTVETIPLSATASSSTGTIASVQFYANDGTTNNLIATVTSSPYNYSWSGMAAGTYTITARAIDNQGSATTSSSVTVTVTVAPPAGYCGSGGPAGFTDYYWKATNVGNIVTYTMHPVGRNVNSTSAIINNSLGNFTMVKQSNGDFTFSHDVGGNTTITLAFTYIIGTTGTQTSSASTHTYVKGINCVYYTTPSTAASNITFPAKGATSFTINWVNGDGSERIVVVRPLSAVDFSPADGTGYSASADFSTGTGLGASGESKVVYTGTGTTVDVTGLIANTLYYVTIYEFNGSGNLSKYLTTGAPVASTTTYLSSPTVALTSPATGASYFTVESVPVSATASSSTGTIASVQFYANNGTTNTLINTDNTAPYSYTWSGMAAGTYTITARAIDNQGSATTSSSVSITVAATPPAGYCGSGGPTGFVDYYWKATNVGNIVTYTFHPVGRNVGSTSATINNSLGNHVMTKQANNDFTYSEDVGANTTITIGFTYLIGTTGTQTSSASTHTYVKGNNCAYYVTPATAASNITFPAKGTTTLTINWTSGDGSDRLVVMREASPVDFVPADNTDYTTNANAVFSAGTTVGTGCKVVYSGTGSTVNVTGLTLGTLYYVTIYEFNGNATYTRYLTAGAPVASVTTYSCAASTAAVLSGTATICTGYSADLAVAISGGSSPFTVVYNNGSGNVTVNNYTSGSAIPVSPSAATTTYTLVSVSGSCGIPGTGISGTATVTTAPPPTLSSTLTPADICTGSVFPYTATSATSSTNFSWTRAAITGITNSAGSGNSAFISETLTNTSAAPIDVVYAFTLGANGCTNPQNITVTVNPRPALSSTLTPADACTGATFAYTATSGTSGTTFSWTRAAVSGISNSAGSGNSAAVSEILTNTTGAPVDVVYAFSLSANGCTNSQNVTVTVNNKPVLSSTLTPADVCSGSTFAYTATGAASGTTFSWTRATVTGISNAAGSGNGANISEMLTNTTSLPVNVVYVITSTVNGCSNPQNVTVTVNPKFTPAVTIAITAGSNPTCSGGNVTFTATPVNGGTTPAYQWYKNSVLVPGATNASYTVAAPASVYVIMTTSIACYTAATATSSTITLTLKDNSWNGSVSTNWNAGANWCSGTVPVATSNIVIPPGLTRYPSLNATSSVHDIEIQAGASFNLNNQQLTITGIVEGTGTIKSTSISKLFITTPGAVGTLYFDPAANSVGTFSQSGAASTITLGNALNVNELLDVSSGTLNTGGFLTLKSTINKTARVGTRTGSANYITGSVTVERYIPAFGHRAWRMLSIPTSGAQTINAAWQEGQAAMANGNPGYGTLLTKVGGGSGYDAATAGNSLLTLVSGAPGSWTGVPSTGSAIATTSGYMVFMRGDRSAPITGGVIAQTATTLRTNGPLYEGSQSAITIPAGNNVLIGNVYASPIDFANITKTGITSFKVWDPKLLGTSNLGGFQTFSSINNYDPTPGGGSYNGVTSNSVIQSGQAFIVSSSSGGNITLTEACKTTGSNNNVFRTTAVTHQIRANLYAEDKDESKLADGVAVVFDDNLDNAIDENDAIKVNNFGEGIAITRAGTALAVEGRKSVQANDTIHFALANMKQQIYKLEIAAQNMDAHIAAYLEDKYLGTKIPVSLAKTSAIAFTVNADAGSSATDRFRLVFDNKAETPLVKFAIEKAYRNKKNVAVQWKVSGENSVEQYEIEKSADGQSFDKAGITPATANTANEVVYNWLDEKASSADIFYRIKSVGVAGEKKYTSVVKVDGIKTGSFRVTPNPVSGSMLIVQLSNQPAGRYQASLLNAMAQPVMKSSFIYNGEANVKLDIAGKVINGLYQLELTNPDGEKLFQTLLINNSK